MNTLFDDLLYVDMTDAYTTQAEVMEVILNAIDLGFSFSELIAIGTAAMDRINADNLVQFDKSVQRALWTAWLDSISHLKSEKPLI